MSIRSLWRLPLLVLGLCMPLLGLAQPTLLQQVLDGLARHPQVRAQFVQQRDNPALAKPQESRGQLLFVLGHGMLWQTTEPFAETLAMTGSRVARVDPQGHLETIRGGQRGASEVSQMLESLLAGQTEQAQRQFTISASGDPQHWQIVFVPRQARMAKVLASITLRGDDYLQGIEVAMANGERTRIQFSQTREAGALSPLERQALGLP